MGTILFTMRLLPDEERLFSSVAKLTGRTKADLVRSIMSVSYTHLTLPTTSRV